MEEGKRMFSIFAARMFEQRVLQAYRERVAQERQMQVSTMYILVCFRDNNLDLIASS